MKNRTALLLLALFLSTCNYAQEKNDFSEIQAFFNVKGNVKEIETRIIIYKTSGEGNSKTKTIFNKTGEPIETIFYDENGNVENKQPWKKASEKDVKGWEEQEEFDTQKKLIKRTKFNNGKIVAENYYKYDSQGNKIEDFEKINDKKIEFKYTNNMLYEEITFNKAKDNTFYWYHKKKIKFDDQSNLLEVNVFYHPDHKIMSEKYKFKYDNKGSLIETVVYIGNEITKKTTRKIRYY